MYSYLHENQKKSKVTRELAVIGSFDDCDTAAVGADARFVCFAHLSSRRRTREPRKRAEISCNVQIGMRSNLQHEIRSSDRSEGGSDAPLFCRYLSIAVKAHRLISLSNIQTSSH